MRVLALALALLAGCTASTPPLEPTPRPTHEPNTLVVSALLDLSGPRSAVGQSQRNAMQLWLDQVQSRAPGTIRLRVRFVDTAGSDTRMLLELRRAVVDDAADAVVVGSPVVVDELFSEAARLAGVPILLTLPTTPLAERWVFSLAPDLRDVAAAQVADMLAREWSTPLVVNEDGSRAARNEERAVRDAVAALPPRPTPSPSPTITGAADRPTVGSPARTLVVCGATSASLAYLRALRPDPGRRIYLSYVTEIAELGELRGVAGLVAAPGSRRLVGPADGERAAFIRAFTDRHGPPSTIAATAYDALQMLDEAVEVAPSDLDRGRLRDRLETRTFAGIVTRYAFTAGRHNGFDARDLVLLTLDARGAPSPAPSATASPSPSPSPARSVP